MLFYHPAELIQFEVPDAWLTASNANGFLPTDESFVANSNPNWPTTFVPISEVKAPQRDPGIIGLHKHPSSGQLLVRDGYHRYFLSIAVGFTFLPVSIRPYFIFEN